MKRFFILLTAGWFHYSMAVYGGTLNLSSTGGSPYNGELLPTFSRDPSGNPWASYFFLYYGGYGTIPGTIYVNLPPSTDANSNGFDDFFEVSQGVSSTVTSGSESTSLSSGTVMATWSRAAGSPNGTCQLHFVDDTYGDLGTYNCPFTLLEYTGPLTYTPGSNTVSAAVNLAQTGNSANTLRGPIVFAKSFTDRFNTLTNQPGVWTNAALQTLSFDSEIFSRGVPTWPTNYVGYVFFADGDPSTASPDYQLWVLSIDATNDANANGVPDFSDIITSSGEETARARLFCLSLRFQGGTDNQSPTIFSQPASQSVPVESNAIFSVTTFGSTPLFYQWRFNGNALSGQTATNLFLADVQFTNAGGYSVIVTNAYGSVTSAVAQLTVYTNLVLTQTNRVPLTNEIGRPTIPTSNYLKVLTNGIFTNGITLNTNVMTVVLTHGWNDNPNTWALYTASLIKANLHSPTPNIVAWDWSGEAQSQWYDLGLEADKTPGQGYALAQALYQSLGPSYSHPIHFIGHSLGTLVNGTAAQYLEDNGYSGANIQMTLFDEAEVAWGVSANRWQLVTSLPTLFATLSANFSTAEPYFDQPLPQQFAWADNYVSAFGLLHPEAANVILTDGFPTTAPNPTALHDELLAFHDYPMNWYDETIQNNGASIMGFRWSFEDGGFFNQAPAANSVYLQSDSSSPWNLEKIDFVTGEQQLDARFQQYVNVLKATGLQTVGNAMTDNGQVTGQMLATGPANAWDMIFNLQTGAGNGSQIQNLNAQALGGPVPNGTSSGNTPAYVWIPLNVPSNAVSISFDFVLQGNGNDDSFQVALDGTNVLSLETSLIQTNVTLNSGLINVSQYAGQQVELFLGIVGGTSTNAALTVSDFQFYVALPPTLQAQLSGSDLILSWPLSANNYDLETTTNLTASNSWTVVTNVPVIMDFEYTVTNQISEPCRFYRLAIITAPTLQAHVSENNIILSWPTWAQNCSLQTTTNLADPNSWTTLTNVPAIVNLQNAVTNPISDSMRFYRLKQ